MLVCGQLTSIEMKTFLYCCDIIISALKGEGVTEMHEKLNKELVEIGEA